MLKVVPSIAAETVAFALECPEVSEGSAWWSSVRTLHVAKRAMCFLHVAFQRCSAYHSQELSGKVFISK